MLLVVASRLDQDAKRFVAHCGPQCATMLTCEDVSSRGWRLELSAPHRSVAVASGRKIAYADITGVLVRRQSVFPEELTAIDPADRGYVAAEMHAFLLAWLSTLRCPVLNRPTPLCLSGPHWRMEQWVHSAVRLGIAVRPRTRRVTLGNLEPVVHSATDLVEVTVVGEDCFGDEDNRWGQAALRVAHAAAVGLLAVQFDRAAPDPTMIGVNTFPGLSNDRIADAVSAHFRRANQP